MFVPQVLFKINNSGLRMLASKLYNVNFSEQTVRMTTDLSDGWQLERTMEVNILTGSS